MNEDVGILQHALHALGVAHEVGGQIAAIELHAVHGLQLCGHGLRFLDRDHAVLANLLHRVGDDVADGRVAVGGNHADLGDHIAGDGLGQLLDFFDSHFDGPLDAALNGHGVRAGGDGLDAFAEDGLGQNGGGGGAVAGYVGGFRRHFTHHLCAHVLERILQLDLFGYRHTVFGDARSAELLLQNNVAALGAEGDLHCVGELVDAAQDGLAGLIAIDYLFCHECFPCCVNSIRSAGRLASLGGCVQNAEDIFLAHDQVVLVIHSDFIAGIFSEQDAIADFDIEGDQLAVFESLTTPDGHDFGFLRFLLGGIGNDDSAACCFLFFDALHYDAVVQGSNVHNMSISI